LGQEDYNFKATWGYIVSLCLQEKKKKEREREERVQAAPPR
jgi:hypothetical protein